VAAVIPAEVVTEAANALHGEIRGNSITLAGAAAFLGQHRVARRNPYLPSSQFAKGWLTDLARVALAELVAQGKAEKILTAGSRRDEVRGWIGI
jgi:hypothetical protein